MRVLIVDDQVHIRQGLQALLAAWPEIEVVGMAANGIEAVQLAEKCRPDVVLMDIPMLVSVLPAPAYPDGQSRAAAACGQRRLAQMDDRPGSGVEEIDGLEAIRLIKSRWPQVRVVVLTMYTAHRTAALAAGAGAFLLKGCPAEALRDAILNTR